MDDGSSDSFLSVEHGALDHAYLCEADADILMVFVLLRGSERTYLTKRSSGTTLIFYWTRAGLTVDNLFLNS